MLKCDKDNKLNNVVKQKRLHFNLRLVKYFFNA